MKKIMMLFVAMMLVVGFSGQAMAAFENAHLVRVVYTGGATGMETATDLGDISTITATTTANYLFSGQGKFDLAAIGGNATNSFVTYFAVVPSGATRAWLSGSDGGQRVAKSGFSGFAGAQGTTGYTGMLKLAGTSQVTSSSTDPKSFWNTLANGTGSGTMKGFINGGNSDGSANIATANLAGLASTGYVDQKLFYYSAPSGIGNATGVSVATIRTFADGHTELNPVTAPAVPIPAAAYLFGTGLLGLIGIRRKKSA